MLCAALLALAAGTMVACASEPRSRLLNYFFDGVPGVQENVRRQAEKEAAARELAQVESAAAEAAKAAAAASDLNSQAAAAAAGVRISLSQLQPPPAEFESWNDLLARLPVDPLFGLDWSGAVRQGLIRPQGFMPSGQLPQPPFSLDNLTLFLSQIDSQAPVLDLDVTLRPPAVNPLYEVVFPHSSHTVWLSCGSCHPGRLIPHASMTAIIQGESCGMCHGKVAFAPEFQCFRCHTGLTPPDPTFLRGELEAPERSPGPLSSVLVRGRTLYADLCAVCHGADGDGNGRLAPTLQIPPRDFRPGEFRFRSTLAPSLPTDEDLFTVVTRGVPNSSMPAFGRLPAEDRWALVEQVKDFSDRFDRESPRVPLEIPAPPEFTPELVERGRAVYLEVGCDACHGPEGGGDGRAATVVRDAHGRRNPPLDFRSGRPIKSGPNPEDVYRVIMTGLEGTPMPGFARALDPEPAWALVAYIEAQRGSRRAPWAVKGDIPFRRESAETEPPPAVFPHWKHRTRLKCASCHPAPFAMKMGTAKVSMEGIRRGEYCGTCHNGRTAFEPGFETCVRCHLR